MDFAFLIHSRDYTDIQRRFKIAKFLPKRLIEFWCLHWPPVLVSKITSLKNVAGHNVNGYIIGIPMTAKQILNNKELAIKRILQSLQKAERMGAGIVGLGALTSSITDGGNLLLEKIKTKITNGNAFTVSVAFDHVSYLIEENKEVKKISIVGGTGSVGRALTLKLAEKYPDKEYYIFARTKENIEKLILELRQINNKIVARGFINNLVKVIETELVVVATSSQDAIISSNHLMENAIIYDITQPQNLDKDTLINRHDLKIYDGGLLKIENLNSKLPFGLPEKIVFACLGETILLALENYRDNFSIGKVEVKQVEYIKKISEKYNYLPIKL